MNIHVCGRCEGSGHVTGGFQWEVPWTRWAGNANHASGETGILRAHVCPDCEGTGALLILPDAAPPLRLPTRRGIQSRTYADHVALVLQTQALRAGE